MEKPVVDVVHLSVPECLQQSPQQCREVHINARVGNFWKKLKFQKSPPPFLGANRMGTAIVRLFDAADCCHHHSGKWCSCLESGIRYIQKCLETECQKNFKNLKPSKFGALFKTNSFIVIVLSHRSLRTPTNFVLGAMAITVKFRIFFNNF